ncbi:flavin reductase [Salipiger sp.]|uniref:flavin reductase n=1 Tax=Salipiger sp. TaxID=2078585 RepID=UPI003A97F847
MGLNETVEAGVPVSDPKGFRRCLGEFCTGVTVITTQQGGEPFGMTSNSFASVSLDPALVLWSIRRESTSFSAFEGCSHFAVNVLADGQVDLSNRFARSGPGKFEGVDWSGGQGGAPLLGGAAASFECRAFKAYEGGDHLILLGEVLGYRRHNRQPLLFSKGRYAVAVDHPDTRVFPVADMLDGAPGMTQSLLSLLLVRSYSAVAARLEAGRRTAGLGLSLMQARLLKAVQMFPDRTLEQLLPELLLDAEAALIAQDSVETMGLVSQDDTGRIRLTSAGEARLHALLDHARASEDYMFRNIPPEDLATVQRVLGQIIEEGGGAE